METPTPFQLLPRNMQPQSETPAGSHAAFPDLLDALARELGTQARADALDRLLAQIEKAQLSYPMAQPVPDAACAGDSTQRARRALSLVIDGLASMAAAAEAQGEDNQTPLPTPGPASALARWAGALAISNHGLAEQLAGERVLRDRADAALSRQSSYRTLILELSLSFIHLPAEQLDGAIQAALARMSAVLGADRAYIFQHDLAASTTSNTHEHCGADVAPMIDGLQGLPLGLVSELMEMHRKGLPYGIPDVSSLPLGATRELMMSQGIRSLLTAPMTTDGVADGFVGFDWVHRCHHYGQDEVDVLTLFATLLGNLSQRRTIASSLQRQTEALARAHDRLTRVLDGTNAGLYVADMQTHEVLFVNELSRRLLGQDMLGKLCWKVIQGRTDGPCGFCTNPRLLNSDGTPAPPVIWEHYNPVLNRWYQLHDQAIPWDDGRYVRLEIALDITEQKRLELSLRESEERYRELFEQSPDALMIVAPPEWRFIAGNPAMARLFGASSLDELLALAPADLSPPLQPDGSASAPRTRALIEIALSQGHWSGEWVYRRLDGRELVCAVQLNRTEIGGRAVVQGIVRDITDFKRQQLQLQRIAHYDPLTQLPNRVLLADRLQQAMAQASRRGRCIAIVYLDLDGFKEVNDQRGHDAGDRVLVSIAQRMRQTLRESDTLARLGGDEFVAVLDDLATPQACLPTLSRLIEAARLEMRDGGVSLRVSASLGVTFYPQAQGIDADQLLRQADHAMYQAKQSGKNRFHLFDIERDIALRGHHATLADLARALERQEFVLHYQPKVDMQDGTVVGVEALIRWQHPDGRLLLPGGFLPALEGQPLALDLGRWVAENAMAQLARWQAQGLPLSMAINISAGELQSPGFLETMANLLASYPHVAPNQLQLEILESSALQDLGHVAELMTHCRALGLRFAIDDFGTGYASLTYLKHLPAETLKIDRSFVRDILDDPESLSILEGVIGLARAFRRDVVAEGVESIEQGAVLLRLGCRIAQGFGIARPMPAEDVAAWVAAWRNPAPWQAQARMNGSPEAP
ncbi:MAG: EAL domain-containing protein [Aquimonas sp.]|nr:EAL domain-containing protein [Aquimonas sp.]